MSTTRREEALDLSEELLSDIELSRIEPMAVIRKASRLARLLDDTDAMQWLSYETNGYGAPPGKPISPEAWAAAERSRRPSEDEEGQTSANCRLVGEISAWLEGAKTELANGSGDTSSSEMAIVVEREKARRRNQILRGVTEQQSVLDKVIGSVHEYVGERYQELRFGSAVETAFSVVRQEVDGRISALVPDALPMLTAAFENAASDNPEHWQSAAGTCRRLLMTAADRLRPPGEDVNGRKMGQGNYVNRLVDWIVSQAESETAAEMTVTELQHLGPRLDAADGAGQKGAHVGENPVTRVEASRFLTGTYLVLGDILAYAGTEAEAPAFTSGTAEVAVPEDAVPVAEDESARAL